MSDEMVEEIHAVRKRICEECGYDFQKLGDRFVRLQEEHPERLVTEVPRTPTESAAQTGTP